MRIAGIRVLGAVGTGGCGVGNLGTLCAVRLLAPFLRPVMLEIRGRLTRQASPPSSLPWGDPLPSGFPNPSGKGLLEACGSPLSFSHPLKIRGDAIDLGDVPTRRNYGVAIRIAFRPGAFAPALPLRTPLGGPAPRRGARGGILARPRARGRELLRARPRLGTGSMSANPRCPLLPRLLRAGHPSGSSFGRPRKAILTTARPQIPELG